jgi:teichuronic acid biosynthesis glycosyltransferase TuaC
MYPTPRDPGRGPFVRDQVEALRRRGDLEVELFAFPPGPRALAGAAFRLRRRFGRRRFDIVHAHFGLTAWPALLANLGPVVVTLHGNDLLVRRSYLATRAALPFTALAAAVSRDFSRNLPGAGTTRRVAILPVGIDLDRFRPIPREEARARLGLNPGGPYVLFPHDPSRPLKRHDRALAAAGDVPLLTLGGVAAEEVPYWINAANAVLVTSQAEGFGLAAIEALACGVPPLATPVGIHPVALAGVAGAYCAPWDLDAWRAALRPHLAAADPRVEGRSRAALFSADAMAARVVEAWRALLEGEPAPDLYSDRPHERPHATPHPPARR